MSRDDLNRQAFKEEALELLGELESSLLELDDDPANQGTVDRVFRAMHTIKGSGAMFGFEDIATFTHEVETVFDLARNGQIRVSKELLDLTLLARDMILSMLEGTEQGLAPKAREIMRGLQALVPSEEKPADQKIVQEKPTQPQEHSCSLNPNLSTYRIRFAPHARLFLTGTNPASLIEELCELGESHVIMHYRDIPDLSDLDPELCLLFWDIVLTTDQVKTLCVMCLFL